MDVPTDYLQLRVSIKKSQYDVAELLSVRLALTQITLFTFHT